MAITSQIVQVAANIVAAPAPSTLQQSGAIVSVGGTTQSTNTFVFYSSMAALTAALSSTGNFTEVSHMGTTFFAQGNDIGVWVLELGAQGSAAAGIAALSTFVAANPNLFYAYLVPATWDTSAAAMNTLAATYSATTSKTYFFVTTTLATMTAYAPTSKAIVATVPSPTAAASEFQAAALFSEFLANNPSIAAPSAPMNFRYLAGVTPWVMSTGATNNTATINSILSLNGNVILTGAEGGISLATLRNGTMIDGNQMMFWYAVDWILIQAQQQLANAVINGSNTNPPLYYNQFGINTLLAVLNKLGVTGTSFGLLLHASFTATPFATYVAANPSDYAAGIYKGFACTATPQLGFTSITFFLTATEFAA